MKGARRVTHGATERCSRRVTFAHDLETLQDPLPTVRVVFNIHLSPADLMTDSEIEQVPKPQRKPLRRLFGNLASLCDMLDSEEFNPGCRQCDDCDRTFAGDHDWHHTPESKDHEWVCDTCYSDTEEKSAVDELTEKMADLSLSDSEEKVPETEETIECPNCWCDTTQSELDSEDGCSECGLGTNTDEKGMGIGCDFCERCYSDECDWSNGNRVLAEYDIPHDWLSVCPECQTDDDLMERLDTEAEEYAVEYFRRHHPKKYNKVLDGVLECMGLPGIRHRVVKKNANVEIPDDDSDLFLLAY